MQFVLLHVNSSKDSNDVLTVNGFDQTPFPGDLAKQPPVVPTQVGAAPADVEPTLPADATLRADHPGSPGINGEELEKPEKPGDGSCTSLSADMPEKANQSLEPKIFEGPDDGKHEHAVQQVHACGVSQGSAVPQTPKDNKVVTSLEQGLKFQEFMVDELCTHYDHDLDSLVYRLSEDSLSTCYSGIESAHCASLMTSRAITKRAGCEKIDVPILHMVEWQADSRGELLLLAERHNSCVFGDLEDFFRPEVRDVVQELKARGNRKTNTGHIVGVKTS